MDLQRERDGDITGQIYDDDVKFNLSLKEDLFLLPRDIKMLSY